MRGPIKDIRRLLWFTLGAAALLLGGIGILLPVMPTTPFMILAAFAFSRSAPRFQQWLEESRAFGPAIADWRANGAIAPRHKAFATATMAGSLVLSVALSFAWQIIAVQAVCLSGAAAFVLTRPNGPPPPS